MNYVLKENAPVDPQEAVIVNPPSKELSQTEWLKLRCLFDNDFESDPIIKANV